MRKYGIALTPTQAAFVESWARDHQVGVPEAVRAMVDAALHQAVKLSRPSR